MVIQVCTAPDVSSKVNRESHTTIRQENITNDSLLQLKTDGETSIEQNTYFNHLNVFLHRINDVWSNALLPSITCS